MRVEYELTADDYVQVTTYAGLSIEGLLATVALLIGLHLLLLPDKPTPSWLPNAFWFATLLVLWIMVFRRVRRPERKPSRSLLWGMRIAALVVWALVVASTARDSTLIVTVVVSLVPLLLVAADVLSEPLRRRLQRSQWQTMELTHGRLTLEIMDTGLSIAGPQTSGTYAWTAIKAVEQTRDLILLKLTKATFIAVPKRAFASQPEQEHFLSFLQTHLSAPGSASEPQPQA